MGGPGNGLQGSINILEEEAGLPRSASARRGAHGGRS